jgi:phage terminase large subunit-like protein
MRAGPKRAVDDSVLLPFRPRSSGSARFAAFCEKFVKVRESKRVVPLRMRPWQRELVGSMLDADTQPRVAAWCLPRGQRKSTLVAALGVYELLTGGEGATVIVAAVDGRQAGIVFNVAARIIELTTT